MSPERLVMRTNDTERDVTVDASGEVTIEGASGPYRVRRSTHGVHVAAGDRIHRAVTAVDGQTRWVFIDGLTFAIDVQRRGRGGRRRARGDSLAAPMPATVVDVPVSAGDSVSAGDTLVVLEAMKMELWVRAPIDGTVTAVRCRQGELVQPGEPLVEME